MTVNSKRGIIFALIAALAQAVASFVPETTASALACLLVALSLAAAFEYSGRPLRHFFCFGVLFHLLAFYWLPDTLTLFGGFPDFVSYLLFGLYCVASSVQFVFVAYLALKLEKTWLRGLALSLPIAWTIGEFLVPRLFPWGLEHCLVNVKPVSALAEFVGIYPLGGLMMWVGCLITNPRVHRNRQLHAGAAAVLTILLFIGFRATEASREAIKSAPKVDAALVQGNLGAKEKGRSSSLDPNLETYRQLTAQAIEAGARFVIWPESVATFFLPEDIGEIRSSPKKISEGLSTPLLFGGLSWRLRPGVDRSTVHSLGSDSVLRFNTAFGVDASGTVVGKYHKRILMPFGEYLPLRETFPSVKQLSPMSGDFAFGDLEAPIPFELFDTTGKLQSVKIMPLICYEDLVPSLARLGANEKAQILVNLTNDAWYGDTRAPHQHHLLAQWRAIETRRYFLRATNTGLTAIVNPLGETEKSLPTFSKGILSAPVAVLDGQTLYMRFGDWFSWLIVLVAAFSLALQAFRSKRVH